jgi:uncharacterized protein YjiS (DUF1127 family)
MEGTSLILDARRPHAHAGFALIEILAALIAGAGCALARAAEAYAARQQRAQARRDLASLSDRSLRDIGLERSQIEQLFR